MSLKEVKATRYGGKCAKCGREIKQGWSIGFDTESKAIYCKPCFAPMLAKENANNDVSTSPNVSNDQFDVLLDMLGKQGQQLGALNEQVSILVCSLALPATKAKK